MKMLRLLLLILAMYQITASAAEPKMGESVLAFFQAGNLYFVGTVVEQDTATKGVFRVVFETGDILSVAAAQIRPLEIKAGSKVFARWKDRKFYPGTVAKVVGRAVYVNYDDGAKRWVSLMGIAVK